MQTLLTQQDTAWQAGLCWEPHPESFRPDYSRCLVQVLPSVLALLGQPSQPPPHLLGHLPNTSPTKAKRVLFLCIDGMGYDAIAFNQGLSSLYQRYGCAITSVFPSITSCALSSLYQALLPAQHGILGRRIYKPVLGGLLDTLQMRLDGAGASLHQAGLGMHLLQASGGILAGDNPSALPVIHIMDRAITGSGLSSLIYGKAPLVGAAHSIEGFAMACMALEDLQKQEKTGWVSMYCSEIDFLSHTRGATSQVVQATLRSLLLALQLLLRQMLPAAQQDTVLCITADHGHHPTPQSISLASETSLALKECCIAVGSSGRVLHLYPKPQQTQRMLQCAHDLLQERGTILPFKAVGELTGLDAHADASASAAVRDSLGSYVALLHRGYTWKTRPPTPLAPYTASIISQHGGLSVNEMFVPFFCMPASALIAEAF